MKNNLPYFTHDNDAGSHWKLKALRARFGWEGYGRFWRLIEMIAGAEDCRLNIGKPQILTDCALELSLSVDTLNEFISFLADPEQGDLLLSEDGFLTTDRAQEDLERVMRTRRADRERARKQFRAESGRFRADSGRKTENPTEDSEGSAAEQSRVEETRAEQSSNGARPPAACPLFFPAQIQERLAFAQLDVTLDEAGAGQVAQALQAAGCEDLGYLDWAMERISARANGKPINNPAGYLLSVVGLADWISAWRQEVALRAAVHRTPALASPAGSPEPDNPVKVAQLLGELPWKPGGRRKKEPDPAPPAAPELPAPTDSGGAS